MARSIKVDELSTSKALSSVALLVGYKQLKHKQKAVKEFVSGRDVFVSLPTGSGASLYAVLPAAVNVKSPLYTTLQADGVALFLTHSHGCRYVWTSHTQGHTQNYIIRQNSTIIHLETEASSESPDSSSSLPFHSAH